MTDSPGSHELRLKSRQLGKDGNASFRTLDGGLLGRYFSPWIHEKRTELIPGRPNHAFRVDHQPAAPGKKDVEVLKVTM